MVKRRDDAQVEVLRQQAWSFHSKRYGYPLIARELGLSVPTVRRYVKEMMKRTNQERTEAGQHDLEEALAHEAHIMAECWSSIQHHEDMMNEEQARRDEVNIGRQERDAELLPSARYNSQFHERNKAQFLEVASHANERWCRMLGIITMGSKVDATIDVKVRLGELDRMLHTPMTIEFPSVEDVPDEFLTAEDRLLEGS